MATKFKLRNRQLRHEWWLDDRFRPLSVEQKLLFLGLHNLADDEGRLVYAPQEIVLKLLPNTDINNPRETVEALIKAQLLTCYGAGDTVYLEITDFDRQPRRGRQISHLPAPSEGRLLQ